jgi:hypothetical protein
MSLRRLVSTTGSVWRVGKMTGLAMVAMALVVSMSWSGLSSAASPPQLPTPPGAGATHTAWVQWAALEREAMQNTDWMALLQHNGCTVTGVSVLPVTSNGSEGIPAGIVTDNVEATGHCPPGSPTAMTPNVAQITPETTSTTVSSSSAQVSPDTATSCNDLVWCNAAGITDGVIAGGQDASNSSYVGAEYTYTNSSGSAYGHVMLGNGCYEINPCCGPGGAFANSGNATLYYDDWLWVLTVLPSDANVMAPTWWEDNNGSYSDWGFYCMPPPPGDGANS